MSGHQVILLGADSPIGLSVIRELGEHGVSVHAVGGNQHSIGLHSRYVASRHVRASGENALIHQLDKIGRRRSCPWVMTIGESDILMLQRRQSDFAYVKPIIPDPGPFSVVLDKAETYAAARAVGIHVPRVWQIGELEELDTLKNKLAFPLVLKWSNPFHVTQQLAASGHSLEKYRYVYSFEELRDYLRQYQIVGKFPLLQEFCPGVGLGQMLFMHSGEALQRFQHIRIAEWPPEGGVSAVCESLPASAYPELMENSVQLLQQLKWEGPAMVEYRFDPTTAEACLMEINGRFWGSLPLAYQAGAGFAWLTYQAGIGAEPRVPPAYKEGLRCRYFAPEIKRLAKVLFSPDSIQNRALKFRPWKELAGFMSGYFRPHTCYYVFSLNDPLPFFVDLWGAAKTKVLRRG